MMLPYVVLFGIKINMYKFFFYMGLITVPIILFALRNKFGFTKAQALKYTVITLIFGLFAAYLTAVLKRTMLGFASGGVYSDSEVLRNYGIPIFLPVFWLIVCALLKDNFRKVTDYIAPCVYSVMTCVKIGCAFWGCCYGAQAEHGLWNMKLGYNTFPVQLYDALTSFAIVIICFILIKILGSKHYGYVYPIGGILFAITKGFWENYRIHDSVYEQNFLNSGFTLWQYWLMALLIGCVIWIVIVYRKERKEKNTSSSLSKRKKQRKY